MAIDLSEYKDVSERVQEFYAKHPAGSIQSEVIEITDKRVTVKAYAYRTPDDPRPGIGHSWLAIPGATAFTRGSEIENAETSAWGRALAALGFATKHIASADEVRSKQPAPKADKWVDGAHTFVAAAMTAYGITEEEVFRTLSVANGDELIEKAKRTTGDWKALASEIKKARGA